MITSNNEAYFNELHYRYAASLFGLCYKILKDEELASETRNEALLKMQSYLKKQCEPEKNWTEDCIKQLIRSPEAYLSRVANNLCIDMLRNDVRINNKDEDKRKEIDTMSDRSFLNDEYDGERWIDFRLMSTQQQPELELLITQLPEQDRTCMTLFYFANCSYKDIARDLNYTFDDVKVIMKRAQRNLKTIANNNRNN
jgi:RNA polymerase sigma factor (sigma-70 family)